MSSRLGRLGIGPVDRRRRRHHHVGESVPTRRLQHLHGPGGVGEVAGHGVGQRAGHRRPGGQVHDGVGPVDHLVELLGVEDRPLDELDAVETGQVGPESGGEVVEGHDLVDARVRDERPAEIAPDETGTAGDHHLHGWTSTVTRPRPSRLPGFADRCTGEDYSRSMVGPVEPIPGIEDVGGVPPDELEVEGVVIGDDDHPVRRRQLLGGQLDQRVRHGRVRQVGIDDPYLGPERREQMGDGGARSLTGVAGVALVGQAEEEDPRAVDGAAHPVERQDQTPDDIVGHVFVDVVGQLDEPERLAEASGGPSTTGSWGRWAGSGRPLRDRG